MYAYGRKKTKIILQTMRKKDFIECLKNTILNKLAIVNDKQMIIEMLQENIKTLESPKTFATLASLPASTAQTLRPETSKNIPPVITKPMQKQDTAERQKQNSVQNYSLSAICEHQFYEDGKEWHCVYQLQ